MASLPLPAITEQEYLRLEREADSKSEFHDGQIFAMAGASYAHSELTVNLTYLLRRDVQSPCATFHSDLKIKIAAARVYTYADCGVVCGEPKFADGEHDALLNPLLIVEVLSPSTANYDRGAKFELYRTIETFCEYLVVHQNRPHIEYYSRQLDGSWLLREYTTLESELRIERLGLTIRLAEVYPTAV